MGKRKGVKDLFEGRHFDREVIILCVRWYLRYKLSLRDLVEMMAERGLSLAHTTIMRWVQRYVPEFEKRWNRFARPVGRSWRVDETYVKIRGEWTLSLPCRRQRGKDRRFHAERQARRRRRQGVLPASDQRPGQTALIRSRSTAIRRLIARRKEALGEACSSGNQCKIRSSKYLTDVFDKAFPNRHGGALFQTDAQRFPS